MSDVRAAARRVSRLTLSDFRSYSDLDIGLDAGMVAFVGDNGAGKTNLLEALSLFTPGRGLRRSPFTDMARTGGNGGFAIAITLDATTDDARLGTGLDPAATARKCRIDGAAVPSPSAFADYLRVVWLTPALDGLFTGPAGDRRRFLDRMVLTIDPAHGSRTNAFERALASRNRVLQEQSSDSRWLDSIEQEVAELGVAVSAARLDAVAQLQALIEASRDPASPFPAASIRLEGALERELALDAAVDVEDRFRRVLRESRARDRAAGRALNGPQTSDLSVDHADKNIPAARCSTGEQKALLIGLVLAHARLVAAMSAIAPLVLLDEVAAHLDPRRREALFSALETIGSQIFMTGADPALFADLPVTALTCFVTPGHVMQGVCQ
ncbi:DNA replication/repair protein RecF [Pseudochelatococcus contaminans]|uniref:DNA replication and repair protein RecF n=1 Tax=Pseudochelatococcus contaminans TaxID=1538103 RepID=A0A7W5Z4R2_9HYPH|nr:DNA replication and repair protein RecF [Pseudochelatococcus contaminans]